MAVAAEFPLYLSGKPGRSGSPLAVKNPYDGSLVGTTWLAGDAEFETATAAAVTAASVMRAMPAYERASILMTASVELKTRRDEIARTLAGEAGKPIKDATTEVERASMTFHVAAEERCQGFRPRPRRPALRD